MLRGSLVAMVTPFVNGEVDSDALARLLERQLAHGTHGIVMCGTTGETPALSGEEFERVVRLAHSVIGNRLPLVVGTGTNCTRTSVERTRLALELGADAALVVTPYYNKPTPDGLVAHFREVASAGLPVIAYNVPGRTGLRPSLKTLLRICRLPGVVGLKEASDDIGLAYELAAELDDDFALLSGEDPSAPALWGAGGVGTISVTANVDPARCAAMWNAFAEGRRDEVRSLQRTLLPLHRALFWESNPVPVKEALHQCGLCGSELRLPLVRLSEPLRPGLGEVLARLGLLPG